MQQIQKMFTGQRPYFLHLTQIPKNVTAVVLAPHPDDFDTIGITLRALKLNGNALYLAVVTSGASGVEEHFCSPPTWEKKAYIREEEQRKSCQFFGLAEDQITFLRVQEDFQGHPLFNQENILLIRQYLCKMNPHFVFLPHGCDTNPGHQRTYCMLRKIIETDKLTVVVWLSRDPKTISMRHDIYALFGKAEGAWKSQLLSIHQSQQQRSLNTRGYGFDERILHMNRQIAEELLQSDEKFAEVFELAIWNQGRLRE